jgi:hypothetical protein
MAMKPEWYYIVKAKKDLDVLGKVEEEVDGDPECLLLLHHKVLEFLVQQLVLCLVTDKKKLLPE